ncbi:hypothetical protein P280DRAFT_465098 [Massarina eburnea CBS 473.64]|uniref:Uncharacterized protein n=1 Tax=Massarina eburnea CBS 473.64 TaxID=1395130 RepID=A0A6A6SBP1_9PLEO|nr:hypothetical protein P280DRAFT_465098 [Massarina eburnea CBS 473.64]
MRFSFWFGCVVLCICVVSAPWVFSGLTVNHSTYSFAPPEYSSNLKLSNLNWGPF